MTDLTTDQLAWLHAQVGTSTPDADLQIAYERLGSVRDVALEQLRERRTAWLRSPLTVNVSGVVSMTLAENVKAVERQIAELAKMDDDPSDDPGGGTDLTAEFETYSLQRTRQR